MKVGDLVNFHTGGWVFKHAECRYANPGMVLAVYPASCGGQQSAEVYWRDGKITREYDSYLKSAMIDESIELSDEQLENVQGGMSPSQFDHWRCGVINESG